MKVLFPSIAVAILSLSLSSYATAADEPPAQYQSSCFACHSTGAANAPKTGDSAAWEPRFKSGINGLIASVRQGKGAMPPNGLCADCSDEDIKALIEYMSGHKF
jgi:cytochrome c5